MYSALLTMTSTIFVPDTLALTTPDRSHLYHKPFSDFRNSSKLSKLSASKPRHCIFTSQQVPRAYNTPRGHGADFAHPLQACEPARIVNLPIPQTTLDRYIVSDAGQPVEFLSKGKHQDAEFPANEATSGRAECYAASEGSPARCGDGLHIFHNVPKQRDLECQRKV